MFETVLSISVGINNLPVFNRRGVQSKVQKETKLTLTRAVEVKKWFYKRSKYFMIK
jgi:hypothetical protein